MNLHVYVQALGMNQTHFENPHGLNHRMHKSSAWDMAQVALKPHPKNACSQIK
jgi:D-alanyl-D-alanine carboxypeptidase